MFGRKDARPLWYTVRVFYKGGQNFDDRAVALNGGRYFTIAPKSGYLLWQELYSFKYCYLAKEFLEWSLYRLLFRNDDYGDLTAHERFLRCVLVFKSEDEHSGFSDSLKRNKDEFEKRVSM